MLGILAIMAVSIDGGVAMVLGWEKNDPGEMPAVASMLLACDRLIYRALVRPRVDVFKDGLQVVGFWDRCWIPSATVRRIDARTV
ncbi:hypothetical protein [Streptomyces sp. N35]|uniref:hypothetical protein n=1 Tax=Streptomyces sp. N35 TaxID=2795730 RepID=UPI0018F29165|nr:hypothetical protein [Streptomyces sp. N35]